MRILKTIFQIPLLLLILCIGSITGYEVFREIQTAGVLKFNWDFYAYTLQGVLEVAVLVWIYRRLDPPTSAQA